MGGGLFSGGGMKCLGWVFLLGWVAGPALAAAVAEAPPLPAALPSPVEAEDEPAPRALFVPHPGLAYQPASATASLAAREASWQALRIRGMNDQDWAHVGPGWMKVTEQGHYYHNAGAVEAFSLYRQGQRARTQGLVWIIASPGVGALSGMVLGAVVGAAQPASAEVRDGTSYSADDERLIHTDEGMALGLVGGALIGLGLGAYEAVHLRGEAHDLRQRAADSFNRKLWRDLRLLAAPKPGGMTLGVQTGF